MLSYRFGPYRLTPEQRLLTKEGTPIALTAKTLDLLILLVEQRGRALSKDEILAAVWPDVVVEEGNLTQQVHLLRRSLRDAPRCLATLPRHGYRFVMAVEPVEEERVANVVGPHCLIWADQVFVLREGDTVLGRADDADVRIPLPTVSRHHARVVVRGSEATIEDLKSRHGVSLGNTRLTDVASLTSGDDIRLGVVEVRYRFVRSADTTI